MNQSTNVLGKVFKRSKASLLVLSALGMLAPSLSYAAEAEDKTEDETEVIEVTGLRSSIITAQQAKMNSSQIMDGISADDIGALPDRSVTETLQRVAGVSIDRYLSIGDPEHFSVEGNGVIVRGLTQVRSELNGRSSFSANGGRTLSFGDVPPELLNAVNIYKSPMASQIEGGLSGIVDLETKLPFHNEGQKVAFNIEGSYGDMIEETTPSYSALYSNTWESDSLGKFGFLADIAYSELSTRNDSMYVRPFFTRDNIIGHEGEDLYVPSGADWRTMNFNRERQGQYVALQWAPADNHEFTFTYFNSQYDMTWDENSIFVSNNSLYDLQVEDGVFSDNGSFISGRLVDNVNGGTKMGANNRISTQSAQTTDFSLAYTYYNDDLEANFEVQRVNAKSELVDAHVNLDIKAPYVNLDLSGSLPSISSDNEYLGNQDNYAWNSLMDEVSDNTSDMTSIKADVNFFINHDVFKSVKVGARFSKSESDNASLGYNWGAVGDWIAQWGGVNDISTLQPGADSLQLASYDNFMAGKTDAVTALWVPTDYYPLNYPNSFTEITDSVDYSWGAGNAWSPQDVMADAFQNNQEEKTAAVYIQADFAFEDLKYPVSGNFGVRYVNTQNTAHGNITYPKQPQFGYDYVNELPYYEQVESEHDYDNFLPSLNVKVEFRDDLFLRFAAAKTMARPAFNSLKQQLNLDAEIPEGVRKDFIDPEDPTNPDGSPKYIKEPTADDFVGTGDSDNNPYLDPMEATQFDVSLEWYYAEASSAYIALFTKDITGYQVQEFTYETYTPGEYWPLEYKISRPVSTGEADIKGIELSLNHFFTTLPAPFDGLGVQANYTYIDSSAKFEQNSIPVGTDGADYTSEVPMTAISEHNYNLVGIYQKDALTMRLAYSWRSEYLTSVGATGYSGDQAVSADGAVRLDDGSNPKIDYRLPTFNDAAGYLDGSISYNINENLSVTLSGNNLLNTVTENYTVQDSSGQHTSAYYMNDRRYSLSLNGHF